MKSKPRVRIAPSPTGLFHIGTARTALFNYLFAKHYEGEFIVRVEDTDKARSTKEFEQNILDGLDWLGFKADEFYRQSERGEIYKQKLQELISADKAYLSTEETGESKEVIRFRNPGKEIIFTDEVHGEIKFDTTELGDFVIAKNLDEPLFHLAVVVDDGELGITHIIRGEDHISNTPRQILIQEALGYQRPIYAHIPLILAGDRSKLSKRHGATSLAEYRNQGFLPQAVNNFLALLGWSPQAGKDGTDQEVFTMPELIEKFSLEAIQKSGAIFNLDKLNWLNREHLRRLTPDEQTDYVAGALPNLDKKVLAKITTLILDKATNWEEIKKLEADGELAYFFEAPIIDEKMLVWHKLIDRLQYDEALKLEKSYLEEIVERLEKINEQDWNEESVKNAIWDLTETNGRGDVLWPMRVALSGREKSPDPFTLANILGKEETIKRILC